MVYVYPLSSAEERIVLWAARVVPIVAAAAILLLGIVSLASAQH